MTCFATRAVHLEVSYALDTDSFIMALRRFIARRGRPKTIYSDNGKNLVGGEAELRRCLEQWNQSVITEELAQRLIEWRFNTPLASHMGGVWERMIGAVKRALRVVLGLQRPCDEVLQTLLAEVEFMVNSRPLTYVSGYAGDPESLTPNHFLMGSVTEGDGLPPGVFKETDAFCRKRWRHSQLMADHIWRRWRREFVPTLVTRTKWRKHNTNISCGDVVLIVEQEAPRNHWPLAVVEEVYTGTDGVVRSALVRTGGGKYRRPANKLCVLESRGD